MAKLHSSIPVSDNRIIRIRRDRYEQLLAERNSLQIELAALRTQITGSQIRDSKVAAWYEEYCQTKAAMNRLAYQNPSTVN